MRAIAGQAGPVPGRRRRGTLVLTQLRRTQGAAISYFVAARDQAHTFYVQITLGLERGRWVVVELAHQAAGLRAGARGGGPAGAGRRPAPPRQPGTTARRFLQGYLRWLYGQARLPAIADATAGRAGRD